MKWTHAIPGLLLSLTLITAAACPPPPADDAGVADAAADAAIADGATADQAIADSGHADAGGVDGGPCVVDSRGFCIRVPQMRDVPGTGGQLLDIDYVCTLDDDPLHGFVYLQARATNCPPMQACETTVDGAWTSIASTVAPVTAEYDWGGRHNNDVITVHHAGKVYRYYHSSIGFGFRACQLPDCTQVYQADGTTLIEDGCTMARTLPQICVKVADDGTVPALADTFEPCPGDPNYADAGAGD